MNDTEVPVPHNPTPYVHVVRYHEVDPQTHVYHSRYLEIADAGFSDYLADLLGMRYSQFPDHGFDPAVVSTEVTFRAPARYEDRLLVLVKPSHVGRTSFRVSIDIVRESDQVRVATLNTAYVNFDLATASARELPPSIAELLRAHVETAPPG